MREDGNGDEDEEQYQWCRRCMFQKDVRVGSRKRGDGMIQERVDCVDWIRRSEKAHDGQVTVVRGKSGEELLDEGEGKWRS